MIELRAGMLVSTETGQKFHLSEIESITEEIPLEIMNLIQCLPPEPRTHRGTPVPCNLQRFKKSIEGYCAKYKIGQEELERRCNLKKNILSMVKGGHRQLTEEVERVLVEAGVLPEPAPTRPDKGPTEAKTGSKPQNMGKTTEESKVRQI